MVSDLSLTAYLDADWVGNLSDRKSQTDFLILLGGVLVAWASNKQETLSRSSTEAEYGTVATSVEHLEAVRALLN